MTWMTRMTWMKWLTVLILTGLVASPAFAQLEAGRTLWGIEEIGVVLGPLHPDAERRGISEAAILAETISRLQQAGIRVLAEDEWQQTSGRQILYLSVEIVPLDDFPVYSVTIKLQFRQNTCLTRNLVICGTAITWEDAGGIRAVGVSRLASLQQDVRDAVDRFINAYRAENAER